MGPLWPARRTRLALMLALSLSTISAPAYDLFHPVPTDKLRELNTDRPDKTESPVTVDAGHLQYETDLFNWHRDQGAGVRTDAWAINAYNLKLGLLDNVDLQLVFDPSDGQRVEDLNSGGVQTLQGNGDLLFRLKVHLYDGQGWVPAFGVMPFIKSPTAAEGLGNGFTEGGLILPAAWDLPAGFGLGAMAEFDAAHDSVGDHFHVDSIVSASLSHGLLGPSEAYLEYWALVSGEGGVDGQQSLDSGVTWEVVPNVQVDAGVNAGLTEASEDLNPFVGLSLRH